MNVIKQISIRIVALACLLFVMNIVYSNFFFEQDIQEHSSILNSVRKISNNTSVLFLGESSNTSYDLKDRDTNSISRMIDALLPSETVSDVTKPAAHSGIYSVLLDNVQPNPKLKTVIVTMNLRSFSADWVYSELEVPLQKEITLLKKYPPLLNRFLLSFKQYGTNSERKRFEKINVWRNKEFAIPVNGRKTTISEWQQDIERNWLTSDKDQKELAKNYMNNFALIIDENHPRISDFNRIVSISKENGWKLVFNILPENIDLIDNLVGQDLVSIIDNNVKFLSKYYSNRGVVVVNNINLVEDQHFFDREFPTEHYSEEGRMIVANRLADTFN